jgi:hypothetical protein
MKKKSHSQSSSLYRVFQEEIFWEVIVSVTLSRKGYMHMCPILNAFQDKVISLNSSKTVDKKKILHTVSNTSIHCSSDKVVTVYLIHYIFENSTINISSLCISCEDMTCCLSVQYTVYYAMK